MSGATLGAGGAIAPGVVVVTAVHEQEVTAEAVHVLVTVQGMSLVTGRAALSQAKEVARLVEALGHASIESSAVELEGVHLESAGGLLGRSSAAVYRLRIRCNWLDLLPDVLGAITAAKNVRLEGLIWRYPDSEEHYARWLTLAIEQANARASTMAAALGTRIVGIQHVSEQRLEAEEEPARRRAGAELMAPARMRSTAVDLGFELTQRRRVGARVTVQYRVEGFTPTPSTPPDAG